jgi:hypothetical protein
MAEASASSSLGGTRMPESAVTSSERSEHRWRSPDDRRPVEFAAVFVIWGPDEPERRPSQLPQLGGFEGRRRASIRRITVPETHLGSEIAAAPNSDSAGAP